MDDQWGDALRGMANAAARSATQYQTSWTTAEKVAHADEIFNGPDGCVAVLCNGHISALFDRIAELEALSDDR